MEPINLDVKSRKVEKLVTLLVAVLILVVVLAVGGDLAYQHFVLKNDATLQLLLMSSQMKTVLISTFILILIIIIGVFGYLNYKRFSLDSLKKRRTILYGLILILALATLVGGY